MTPIVEVAQAAPGSVVHAALQVHLPEGYHTNSNKPRDPNLIPVTLTFNPPPAGIEITEVVFPAAKELTQRGAVLDAVGRLDLPVVWDLEIGHVPPHLPLVNGALARVVVDGETREITQTLA